jgi:hypothetical protein
MGGGIDEGCPWCAYNDGLHAWINAYRPLLSSLLPPSDEFHDPGSAFGREEEDEDHDGTESEGPGWWKDDDNYGYTGSGRHNTEDRWNRNFVASGSDGDGAAERLVGSPPGPLSADIIRERRDAAWKMSSWGYVDDDDDGNDGAIDDDDGRFWTNEPPLIINNAMPVFGGTMQWEYIHFNKLRGSLSTDR